MRLSLFLQYLEAAGSERVSHGSFHSLRRVYATLTGRGQPEPIDVDALSQQVIRQFGESVTRHELPKPQAMNVRKEENKIMRVSESTMERVVNHSPCSLSNRFTGLNQTVL